MGSVLKRPENVLILRNIAFEGLKSGHKVEDMKFIHVRTEYLDANPTCLDFKKMLDKGELDFLTWYDLVQHGMLDGMNPSCPMMVARIHPAYRGAQHVHAPYSPTDAIGPIGVFSQEDGRYGACNSGHMGNLDDPSTCNRLYGSFIFIAPRSNPAR